MNRFALRFIAPAIALLLAAGLGVAQAGYGKKQTASIYETAKTAGFTTLVAAIDAAGLQKTLSEDGDFTVFAPTNEAFAALPEGALKGLLADREALERVLLYHVVSGKVMAKDAVKLSHATMLDGSEAVIDAKDGVRIAGAKVIKTDIMASNGVIHVIDAVMLPPTESSEQASNFMSIFETAESAGFSTLVTAVRAAGLEETLTMGGPFTVFAPTDEAFAKIPPAQLQALLADTDALKRVLLYHVVSGAVTSGEVVKLKSAKTASGHSLSISAKNGVHVNDATVIEADVMAKNGVIHAIDTVLIPSKS